MAGRNTKDLIRLLNYWPELLEDLFQNCPRPITDDEMRDWVASNEHRLFSFVDARWPESWIADYYSNVDYGVLAEWANRKHQRRLDNTP